MARLFILLVWLAQLGLMVLLIDARWIEEQLAAEREQVVSDIGAVRAQQLHLQAQGVFDRLFVATDVVSRSYSLLLPPDPALPKQAMTGLAPWFFAWLKQRIDAVWLLTFQGILRGLLLCEWLPLVALMIAMASLDGYAQRRIKQANSELASADRYVLARRAALIAAAFPAFYLILPVVVPAAIIAVWGAYCALTCMLLMAHAQHRI